MGLGKIKGAPSCQQLSSQRVFPAAPVTGGEKVVRLSIIDATVTRFSPCAAVWLYDAIEASRNADLLLAHLQQALCETLDDYPHFAGQLRWATDNSQPLRLGRPVVHYGTEEDPGVDFTVAEYDCLLAELVPSEEERKGNQIIWIASDFPQDKLLPSSELAFESHLGRFEGLSGASVQITRFCCGGFAVGIKITHCLSDAVCLVQFAKTWAQKTSALFSGRSKQGDGLGSETLRSAQAVFDPSLLDRHAGIQGQYMDNEKIQLARSLPMHRYDWWKTDAPGYPSWATASSEATKPTEEQLRNIELSPSVAPPWTTWDTSAPVDHAQIRFSGEEVCRIKDAAQAELVQSIACGDDSHSPGSSISRLDALLAHVWILINRARHVESDDSSELVYMDVTLGLRTRLDPPLPNSFAGSPILLMHVSLPGGRVAAAATSLGAVALSIRETMARFTPEAVAAYLHDAAREVSPQRLWQAFLGRRHTLVTSWTRAGCYEVDFVGEGGRPRYVQGRMPRIDGCCQIMDGVGEAGDDFDVSVCLERGALRRLVKDERLRLYDP